MKAVKGSVTSSKPVSLSKAAAVLSRFASADIGAPGEIAAYLRRASSAFDDHVRFRREVRDRRLQRRRSPDLQTHEPDSDDRRKKRAGGDPRKGEATEGLGDGGDGNLTEVERECGVGIERGEDGKTNMKRRIDGDEERSHFGVNDGKIVVGEEERRKKKRNREDEAVGKVLSEVMRDGDGKKNSSLGVEENGEGLGDESAWNSRKKKRRKKIEAGD